MGIWDVTKWGYLNNPRWRTVARRFLPFGPDDYSGRESQEPQVWDTIQGKRSKNGEVTHSQCGHWHKIGATPPLPPVVPPEVPPVDDLYIIRGNPLAGGSFPSGNQCWKRDKSLVEITHYGTYGTGDDQLRCPWGIGVDLTHAWICDTRNTRLMQRLKSDLSYVQKRSSYYGYGGAYAAYSVHAGAGNFIYVGFQHSFQEVLKSDLSTVRQVNAWVEYGQAPEFAEDITSDDNYIYIADSQGNRIIVYDISTLAYVTEFGTDSLWSVTNEGLVYYGGYLYTTDSVNNTVNKINPSTYEIVATYGGPHTGDIYPNGGIAIDSSRVFVSNGDTIQILDHNLDYIRNFTHDSLDYAQAVSVDSSYIYVLDSYGYLLKFDISTYAYIDTSLQTFSFPFGIAVDSTYIYVLDQDDDLNVYRLLKSDLSYIDKYSDVDWAIFADPRSLYVDGTYIYVSDDNYIRRINKSDMTFVDSLLLSDTTSTRQIVIDDSDLYVADYAGGVQHYNLGTQALIDKSPTTEGDSDYWLDYPCGITCDENYLYVCDDSLDVVKIFNKVTKTYVDEFSVTSPHHIAVDETYLYVTSGDAETANSYVRKYLKVAPYTEVDNVIDAYAIGVDTAYIYQQP